SVADAAKPLSAFWSSVRAAPPDTRRLLRFTVESLLALAVLVVLVVDAMSNSSRLVSSRPYVGRWGPCWGLHSGATGDTARRGTRPLPTCGAGRQGGRRPTCVRVASATSEGSDMTDESGVSEDVARDDPRDKHREEGF